MNTAKVTDRRQLRFGSVEEALGEVDRIEAAGRDGRLRQSGNWTAGQIMGHVASWINYPYEGFPIKRAPWPIRVMLKMMKGKMLREGLSAGVRLPGAPEGTYGVEKLSTEEGAARLRAALKRLASDEPTNHDSPAFGPMSHEERIALNLRHAELHLSFLHY